MLIDSAYDRPVTLPLPSALTLTPVAASDGKKRAMAEVRFIKIYSVANGKNTILGKAAAVFPSCQTYTMGLELAPCSVCFRVGYP